MAITNYADLTDLAENLFKKVTLNIQDSENQVLYVQCHLFEQVFS